MRIKRRLLRVLLYYLACHDDVVSRSELILRFWPDEPEDVARAHLRDSLSKLRAQLPEPDLLSVRDEQVGLDFDRVYSDVRNFRAATAQLRQAFHQIAAPIPLTPDLLNLIIDTVHLWRAPHYLSGVQMPRSNEFYQWMIAFAASLEGDRQFLTERLVDHYAANRDLNQAVDWLRKLLEVDELNEELHYLYMHWLVELGRRSEALSHGKYLQNLFKREGLEQIPPSLETLHNNLRQHNNLPDGSAVRLWPETLNTRVPMIGRDGQTSLLRRSYQHGGIAVVWGEAGAGKTRLAYEFFHGLRPAPRMLIARASAMASGMPFQPLIDLLRSSIRESEWMALEEVWQKQLARLLPERAMIPEAGPSFDLEMGPNRAMLFEAIRRILLLLAQTQRIVLLLEDAHWSDETTLSALAYLGERHLFNDHGMLLLTARSEERSAHLDHFCTSLKRPVGLSEIHLGLLDWQDVARFIEAALGKVPDRDLVDRLVRETGGNPLFLLESLHEQTAGSPQDGASPRSAGIKTLMHERLERIGAADRRVLMAAVVLAEKIRLDLLEEVSLLTTEQVVQALENLEAVNLLRPVKHDRWHYSFVHDKIREILYQELNPARQQLLHTRAANALECQAEPVVSREAALLAAHFEAAGDLRKAYQYWLQAGQHAHHLFSRLEAHQAYQRAEHCLAQLGSRLSDAEVYHLYSGWSRLAIDLGDVQVLGYLSFEQNRIAGQRVSALLSGSALSSQGMMQILKNELEAAVQTIQASIHYLEQTDYQYEIIEAYNRLGQAFRYLNRLSEASAALQHGLELGEQAQEFVPLEALINIQCQYSNLMCYMGDPNQALELANQAMKNSERIHYSAGLVRAQLRKVWALYHLCRLQEGIALGNSILPMAHSMGNLRIAASLHMVVARCALLSGQLTLAWENNEQALKLGQENQYPEILSEGFCIRGDTYRMLGDFITAEDSYRTGIDKDGHALQILINRYRLGFCLALTDRVDEGLHLVEQSVQEALAAGIQTVYIPAEVHLSQYFATHLQMNAAKQHCENAERALSTFTAPAVDNAVRLLQSIIASDDAEPAAGTAAIQSVYIKSLQLGDVWVALSSLSRLCLQQQHPEEGAGYRQQMLTLFSQIEQTGIPEPLLLSYQRFKQGFLDE